MLIQLILTDISSSAGLYAAFIPQKSYILAGNDVWDDHIPVQKSENQDDRIH